MTAFDMEPLALVDVDKLVALRQRANDHDRVPRLVDRDLFVEELALADDLQVATKDGEIVGYAYTIHVPSNSLSERCYVMGRVDPQWRRQGIGGPLLDWGIEQATARLHSVNTTKPRMIRTETYDVKEATKTMYESRGLRPARYTNEMRRPVDGFDKGGPDLGSITITDWPSDRSEEIRRVRNAAYLDHWSSRPHSTQQWNKAMARSALRPDLSVVATDNDVIVGYCLNARYPADDPVTGRRDGWIDRLGTAPSHQGQGIATALIQASIRRFAAAGLTHVCLDVDAVSPTGGTRLYRDLNFELINRVVTYEMEV